ncbi:baseplate J/gp47 family protein [Sediminicurvatus halobius]|uniref:Baseplate J protein n=1 Tax=Sediminicurvatus halobius TaxID=2182432 RepID=A0A2U2N1K0_9GAMM|nr:baseplate J/gp47 family protein [Spiribacter halobius]PWG62869.1 baseplate J protein [Spiribacter halobius]UEX76979.1 baseplate J/gp47 family protein [Spiribacter halobius]
MPWQSPTLEQLIERIRADIRARLPGAQPELRRSLLGVLASAEAGAVQGLYGYLDWLARQLMIDTAEAEHLERWAGIWGLSRAAAVPAAGNVDVTGSAGAELPAGIELESDAGQTYTTDTTLTLDAAGTGTVAVTAVEAGADGNLAEGATLRLLTAVTGIDSEAVVAAGGLTGGADEEGDARLRERLLERIRRRPHGGSRDDYERWALEAHPDVTRAWVYPQETDPGTVTVRAVCDELDPITPPAEVTGAIEDYIDAERPVTAGFYVVAPTEAPLDLSIKLTPDSTEVRERVTDALNDFFARVAEPGGTIYREQLSGVIYVAAGESRHELQSPTGDVTHTINEIAVLGVITWL